jgi:hypothetical protein
MASKKPVVITPSELAGILRKFANSLESQPSDDAFLVLTILALARATHCSE